MKAILPFEIRYSPIKALVLIPFAKHPEPVYKGLELQYIDAEESGKGFRVIAYRNDSYVDVYDDYSLTFHADEKFDVAENGLNKHIQTNFGNTSFQKKNGNVEIVFSFKDLLNREISVSMIEHTSRKSIPMNLLAPIGWGSKKPNYLPLFFLYDFDFVRKSKTTANIVIDGKKLKPDKFPVPMNGQFRYFSRYSLNCDLIEFINTDYCELTEVETDKEFCFSKEQVKYLFNSNAELRAINIDAGNSVTSISFEPALALYKGINLAGEFSITPALCMGNIMGNYQIQETMADTYKLSLTPGGGWTPVPNSGITKLILGTKSIFRNWSKNYHLEEEISLKERKVTGKWSNGNL